MRQKLSWKVVLMLALVTLALAYILPIAQTDWLYAKHDQATLIFHNRLMVKGSSRFLSDGEISMYLLMSAISKNVIAISILLFYWTYARWKKER